MLKAFFSKFTFKATHTYQYSAGKSVTGQIRSLNQDSILMDERLGLFLIADGMGGHEGGEIASRLTTETIHNHLKISMSANIIYSTPDKTEKIHQILQSAIEKANNAVHCHNIADGNVGGNGMGSTVTGLWIKPATKDRQGQIFTFNVGDSRIYSYGNGNLQQITSDHSHYQRWLATGMEGPEPGRNTIYKAIGPWRRVIAEQKNYPIKPDSIYLLCSDGLTSMLDNSDICEVLEHHQNKSLESMVQELIDKTDLAGGVDNTSIILVRPSHQNFIDKQ